MTGSKAFIMACMKHLRQLTVALLMSAVFALSPTCATPALALTLGGQVGYTAPDFPEGEFSDGGHYKLSDYAGKQLVVLFFYEQQCPTCRGTIPARNKIVRQFADKPVKFLAIGAGDSIEDVRAYAAQTHLAMPIFADKRSVMQKAYGFHISLGNIYQVRLVDVHGKIIAFDMNPSTIDNALAEMEAEKNRPAPTVGTTDSPPETTAGSPSSMNSASSGTFTQEGGSKGKPKTTVEWKEIPDKEDEDPNAARREQAANLNNEAVAAMKENNNKLAVDKLKQALSSDPTYDLAKKNLQAALTNYGIDLENQGKLNDAEGVMKQALDYADQAFPHDSPNFRNAAENYAGILTKLGRDIEAKAIRSGFLGKEQ